MSPVKSQRTLFPFIQEWDYYEPNTDLDEDPLTKIGTDSRSAYFKTTDWEIVRPSVKHSLLFGWSCLSMACMSTDRYRTPTSSTNRLVNTISYTAGEIVNLNNR